MSTTDQETEQEFVSRRTLVARRFLANRLAVAALVILVLLFVACYALPPLLPFCGLSEDSFHLPPLAFPPRALPLLP